MNVLLKCLSGVAFAVIASASGSGGGGGRRGSYEVPARHDRGEPGDRGCVCARGKPVTPETRAKAIECWSNNSCDTGTGGKIKVAYADGFGENVWRRVTAMEFILAGANLSGNRTYPILVRARETSPRRSLIFKLIRRKASTSSSYLPTPARRLARRFAKQRKLASKSCFITAQRPGTAGKDYLTNVSENICQMGKEFVKAVLTGNPDAKTIVALGGTPAILSARPGRAVLKRRRLNILASRLLASSTQIGPRKGRSMRFGCAFPVR